MRVLAIEPGIAAPDDGLLAVVGAKALGLMRLAALGLPVPPGFVLSTDFARARMARGGAQGEALPELREVLSAQVRAIERRSGLAFGDAGRPLLLAVRSGAAVSMPGMMDTLLNIGLCDRTLPGFVAVTGNPRLAWDCYRRLVQDFAETVHGASARPFEDAAAAAVAEAGAGAVAELDTLSLRALARRFLHVFAGETGAAFPQSAEDQLAAATDAVFRSWDSPRAESYRRIHGIDGRAGTAVTVQQMVFGNGGGTSGAGVGFTRDPASGAKTLYVDFAASAQGEDVVSGRHRVVAGDALAQLMPAIHAELVQVAQRLERAFRDVQDFEFTVEDGRLFLLQTRDAKRTAWAALRIAVDLAQEGLITPAEAVARAEALDKRLLVRRRLDTSGAEPLAPAVSAGTGVAAGRIALSSAAAVRLARDGDVILVRPDVSTEDVAGIAAAAGLLTALGGRTSHAAVVARQLNKVCLVGCGALLHEGDHGRIGDWRFAEGDEITLDGNGGAVYRGRLPVGEERPDDALAALARLRSAAA